MEQFSFVFTIFFMLLGPLKLIPAFAGATIEADKKTKRNSALWAVLIASAVAAFVALAGMSLVNKYRISIDALRIAGGLVLLLAALNTIFAKSQSASNGHSGKTAIKLAVSPIVSPIMIPPAGVAAILLFMMIAPQYPGMDKAVVISLAIIMILNLVVMFFNSEIIKVQALMMILQLLGAILIFMQVGLAVETILVAFRHLGIITG